MPVSAKKHKISRDWIVRHINDPFVKQAQQQGYRARSAFKLIGIDEKYNLFKRDSVVVDLGSAPGGWCQVAQERLKALRGSYPENQVLGLDLLEMEAVHGVTFFQGDFRELEAVERIQGWLAGRRVDVVLSDMAPNLSGVATADAARMQDLLELCHEFCKDYLNPKGVLVTKAFHGSGYSQVIQLYKTLFLKVEAYKPAASRAESAEVYIVARGLKV